MHKFKILVADPVSTRGIEELQRDPMLDVVVKTGLKEDELIAIIGDVHALIVRSETKVTPRVLGAAKLLRVVGRAGVGVDNVDIETATAQGVVVMNTPDGNTTSTAEHAFSLLVSIARMIPHAHASVAAGKWERKKFQGVELHGKTLGILGMGRIGSELARRAIAFGMRVIAYDPYLSETRARSLQVELFEKLDDLVPQADFMSLHLPMTPDTKQILNASRLAMCKPGVRIINCARGGLIDEIALKAELDAGRIAAVALDVFEVEPLAADYPLRGQPNVVLTPHLGASTAEAQESVGIEIAQAVRALLIEGVVRNAVNMPNLDAKTLQIVGPYLEFGLRLGRFISQIASSKRCDQLKINYSGKVNQVDVGPITRAIVKGFLEGAVGSDNVNTVNVLSRAAERGIQVSETRQNALGEFTDLVEVRMESSHEVVSVAGSFFGSRPRIVQINEHYVEVEPSGVLLLLENRDIPGMVGKVGTMLGKVGVNIARMSLSRDEAGGRAFNVLNLDSVLDEKAIKEISNAPDVLSLKMAMLG